MYINIYTQYYDFHNSNAILKYCFKFDIKKKCLWIPFIFYKNELNFIFKFLKIIRYVLIL